MASMARSALSVFVCLVWILVSVIRMLPSFIRRNLVLLLYSEPGDELATSKESYFLTEEGKDMAVYWMVEIGGLIPVEELRQHIMEKCSKRGLKKFCSIPLLVRGNVLWRRDPNFNIQNHVKKFPTTANSEQHLKEIIQECFNQAKSESRLSFARKASPWSVHLIETREETLVLLFIVGHSLTDGVGCMNLFNELLTDHPGLIPQPQLCSSGRTVSTLWRCATHFLDYMSNLDYTKNTFLMEQRTSSIHKDCFDWSQPVPLADIRRVRSVCHGATVNDIVCGVILESLIKYLKLKGVQIPQSKLKLGMYASLRSSQQSYAPANLVGVLYIHVNLSKHASVEERITRISSLTASKKGVDPILSNRKAFVDTYVQVTNMEQLNEIMGRGRGGFPVATSNVPGPQNKVHLMGKPVRRMVFIPISQRAGLIFSISSYNGELRVVAHDVNGIVDTPCIMKLLDGEFQELLTKL